MEIFQKLKISGIPQYSKKSIIGGFESSSHSTAIAEQMFVHLSLSAVTILTSCVEYLNNHLSQI